VERFMGLLSSDTGPTRHLHEEVAMQTHTIEPERRLEQDPDALVERVGMHPLGATLGAIGGAMVGALIGIAAGPVGSLAGAVGGAVIGVAAASGRIATEATGPVTGTPPGPEGVDRETSTPPRATG
jgi:hypothetical protein